MSLKGIFVITGVSEKEKSRINAELKLFHNTIRMMRKNTNQIIFQESQKSNFNTFNLKKLNEELYYDIKNEPVYFFTYDYFNKRKNYVLFEEIHHELFVPNLPDFYGKVSFADNKKEVSKEHLLKFLLSLNENYKCSIYFECLDIDVYYAYHIDKKKIKYHQISTPIFDSDLEYAI